MNLFSDRQLLAKSSLKYLQSLPNIGSEKKKKKKNTISVFPRF